jgi:hypothetical protein
VIENKESTLEFLLRERIRKLESTLHAYDDMLDTRAIDTMRMRNRELESVLLDLSRGSLLPEEQRRRIEVTLGNKFRRKY